MSKIEPTPRPMMDFYEGPLWESIESHSMKLQCCQKCAQYQYPPTPSCWNCISTDLQWKPISGRGKIVSWVIYHRQYLPAYPVPYNVIAVMLEEGPIFISNLEGQTPTGSWIGTNVSLVYTTMPDGFVIPRFEMAK